MREKFESKNFRSDSLEVIDQANEIINIYMNQGYKLTLRQLYYQFVARDLIPNSQKSYDRLGRIVGDGRLAGMIDWNAIEDRTRNLRGLAHWEDEADRIQSAAESFHLDLWDNQPLRIEVWVEKEALAGVIGRACNRLDVPYLSNRGYMSLSEMYDTGRRIRWYREYQSQPTIILHLGDHDPSGIDMTRDIRDRVSMFSLRNIKVERLALNMDQVEEYDPPPNPAKTTDSRYGDYVSQYGYESWELDALEPAVLDSLITARVVELRDDEQWKDDYELQEEMRRNLVTVADNWSEVERYIASLEEENG